MTQSPPLLYEDMYDRFQKTTITIFSNKLLLIVATGRDMHSIKHVKLNHLMFRQTTTINKCQQVANLFVAGY